MDPNNKIIIEGNELSDWGGNLYSGGIAIGKADDNYAVPSAISVEVRSNRITDGPTQSAIYNAAIQAFHPFLAYKNYIHTVSGTSFQNKTFNSRVACNEMVNGIGDGAMITAWVAITYGSTTLSMIPMSGLTTSWETEPSFGET